MGKKNTKKLIVSSGEGNDVRLVLIVTNQCCLKCKYCIVPNVAEYMTWETLRNSVDFLFTSEKKNLQLHFFGGEPLMMPFNLMIMTVLYAENLAEKTKKNIDFMISTNGVLLNMKKILFFKKHNIRLEFSIDGGPRTQNVNRPQNGLITDSYSLATKYIPPIVEKQVPNHVSAVITPFSVNTLIQDFYHLIDTLKFNQMFLMIATTVFWSKKDIKTLENKLNQLKPLYIKLLKKRGLILYNPIEWLPPFRINTEIVVDVDGIVYPACCVVYTGDKKVKKKYALGGLKTLLNKKEKNIVDTIVSRRLENDAGIKVLINKEVLGSNIKAGKVMAKFSKSLGEIIAKDKNLFNIYSKQQKKFH